VLGCRSLSMGVPLKAITASPRPAVEGRAGSDGCQPNP
jgi:hypothetical protein